MDPLFWIAIACIALFWVFYHLVLEGLLALYVHARLAGAPIGLLHLIGMRFRRVKLHEVVYAHIRLHKAGLNKGGSRIPIHALETHYLAGGNLGGVVTAVIGARGARIPLSWSDATAIDLSGGDPSTLVRAVVDADAAGYRLEWLDAAKLRKAGQDPAAVIRERIGATRTATLTPLPPQR